MLRFLKVFCVGFCLYMLTCAHIYVCAQTPANQQDTISKKSKNYSKHHLKTYSEETLQTVEVSAFSLEKYSVGLKKIAVDSANLALYSGRSVGDFLMMQTPLYIKEYGAGMLASASFRGTGAGHTAFVWNGVGIGICEKSTSPSVGEPIPTPFQTKAVCPAPVPRKEALASIPAPYSLI